MRASWSHLFDVWTRDSMHAANFANTRYADCINETTDANKWLHVNETICAWANMHTNIPPACTLIYPACIPTYPACSLFDHMTTGTHKPHWSKVIMALVMVNHSPQDQSGCRYQSRWQHPSTINVTGFPQNLLMLVADRFFITAADLPLYQHRYRKGKRRRQARFPLVIAE